MVDGSNGMECSTYTVIFAKIVQLLLIRWFVADWNTHLIKHFILDCVDEFRGQFVCLECRGRFTATSQKRIQTIPCILCRTIQLHFTTPLKTHKFINNTITSGPYNSINDPDRAKNKIAIHSHTNNRYDPTFSKFRLRVITITLCRGVVIQTKCCLHSNTARNNHTNHIRFNRITAGK